MTGTDHDFPNNFCRCRCPILPTSGRKIKVLDKFRRGTRIEQNKDQLKFMAGILRSIQLFDYG